MWFYKMKTLLASWTGRYRRSSVLRVNTRSGARKVRTQRVTMAALVPTITLASCLVIWLAAKLIGGVLFSHNERFNIVNLDIRTSGMFSRELVKEYTGISEGANLFAVDIEKVRDNFMRRASNVKSLQITRVLPGTMKMEIVERSAVARIDAGENLVVDSEGCVFWQRTASQDVPVLIGIAGEVIRPGSKLANHALSAIDVVEAARDPRFGLNVTSVLVDQPEFVLLRISSSQGEKEVKLSWEGMDTRSPVSQRRLIEKLNMVVDAIHSEKGKNLKKFDATYEGGKVYGS